MNNRINIPAAILAVILMSIPAAATDKADFPADTVRIDNLVVTGTRAAATTANLPMSVSVITERELDGRMEQSVLPILSERVPSLMITSRSVMGYGASTGAAGGISMRGVGGNGTQLLMLIDGHPQFMGIFAHPLADTYQTLMAERIEVVRGPASVLYGSNAMGGVINILTRGQREDETDVRLRAMYGSYNTASTEFSSSTRKGGFNSVLSVGYNRSDGHRENMDFEQYSGYGKLGYDLSTRWRTFVDLDLSKTYSSNPGAVSSPMFDNDMDILRGVASLSVENRYERSSGALKLFYNFGDHYIDDGYGEGGSPRNSRFNSTDWMVGITMFQNYSFFHGNHTTAGFDFQRYGGRAWTSYLDGADDSVIADEYMNDFAAYVNFQQMLGERLTVNAGVRFDHHSVAGSEWIPQAGVTFAAARNTTLKAIVSKGYRNPTLRELYMWGPANPDLKPESLMNYEVAMGQYLLDRRLAFEVNLYYIKGKNSIAEGPADNAAGWQWTNTGRLENFGVELTADYRVTTGLGVNANYSFVRMLENVVPATPVHKLYAGADYTLRKWTFSTGVQYVHDLVLDEQATKDSFVLWNARVSYRATRWLTLMLRGENLLDRKYEMYTGYPMPGATVFGGIALKF